VPKIIRQKCKLETKQLWTQLFEKQKLITEESETMAGPSSFQLTSQGGDEDREKEMEMKVMIIKLFLIPLIIISSRQLRKLLGTL
jgi:hypothetical protein